MANVEFEGFNEIINGLNKLGGKANEAENRILKKAGEIVRDEASRRAPRSRLNKKHLADNIKISKIQSKNGKKYILVGPGKGDNSEFFYGKFIEYGTSKKPARPFLEPALRESGNEIFDEAKKILRETLEL